MKDLWRKEALVDVVNLALAAWLFFTPWMFGFTAEPAAWNASLSGLAIGAIAIAALVEFAEWEEWTNLALGMWVAMSVWVIGFADHAAATLVHLTVGSIVTIAAALRLWLLHHSPSQVTETGARSRPGSWR
jgi:hypothetical protein